MRGRCRPSAVAEPELGHRLDDALPYTGAEVAWAARTEMARTVEDVLARRTRALFLNAKAAARMAPAVAAIVARELGRDEAWQRREIASFVQLARSYSLRLTPPGRGLLLAARTTQAARLLRGEQAVVDLAVLAGLLDLPAALIGEGELVLGRGVGRCFLHDPRERADREVEAAAAVLEQPVDEVRLQVVRVERLGLRQQASHCASSPAR